MHLSWIRTVALATCLAAAQHLLAVATWERWETSLTASKSYTNPYADTTVAVTFTQGSTSFSTYAFWDGGSTWRIRCAFPTSGTWTWTTTATDTADTGLHNKSGSVSITTYSGTNPLFKNGFLKVSSDKRYLVHANNTPFLWNGDTAWRAPQAATLAEWKTYVDNRVDHKVNVIQISPYVNWDSTVAQDTSGNNPWTTAHTRINPAYWQGLDAKINYANDKGVLVVLIGLPGGEDFITSGTTSATDRQRFARQFVGRYYGNHVIFSPDFDKNYASHFNDMGTKVREATSRHLISQHPNTPSISTSPDTNSTANSFYTQTYLDFSMNQSGHHSGAINNVAKAARVWNLALYNKSADPKKPVINVEAYYEGDPSATSSAYKGTAANVRLGAYYSWLSGSLGFTNGVLGLWNWGKVSGGISVNPTTAMARTSTDHLEYLVELLSPLEWWKLIPAHDLIGNQSTTESTKMVLAKASDGSFAMAYLPNNTSIQVALGSFPGSLKSRWFNPTTGTFSAGESGIANSGSKTFTRPTSGSTDWVLLLERETGTPVNQAPTANAGADQAVTDSDNSGSESVTLSGTASSDSDGTISSYAWSWSGGTATGATANVSLPVGSTTVTLTVTDDDGASATDSVVVTVSAGGTSGTAIVIDNSDSRFAYSAGWWSLNLSGASADTVHTVGSSAASSATLSPGLTGAHTVEVFQPAWTRSSPEVTVTVNHVDGTNSFKFSQAANPGVWVKLGTAALTLDTASTVVFSGLAAQDADTTEERVLVDAVRLTPTGTPGGGGPTGPWFESEDYDASSSVQPWSVVNDTGASGGAYLVVPEGSTPSVIGGAPSSGYLDYSFELEASGPVYIALKLYETSASSNGSDSLYIDILEDSLPATEWSTGFNTLDTWFWANWTTGKPTSLSAGTYTLRISYREDGFRLDRIGISSSPLNTTGQ